VAHSNALILAERMRFIVAALDAMGDNAEGESAHLISQLKNTLSSVLRDMDALAYGLDTTYCDVTRYMPVIPSQA
jgi:hypothetical protein